jgi:pimeloyl-ACP methyl ester carboxylesterase
LTWHLERITLVDNPTFYRTVQVNGLAIFYREAGPQDAPALLLLHGLSSSSRMFTVDGHASGYERAGIAW